MFWRDDLIPCFSHVIPDSQPTLQVPLSDLGCREGGWGLEGGGGGGGGGGQTLMVSVRPTSHAPMHKTSRTCIPAVSGGRVYTQVIIESAYTRQTHL